MIVLRSRAHHRMCGLLGSFIVLVGHVAFGAQNPVGVTEITTELLVFSTTAGNVVASVGPDGALLVGTPPVTSTPHINSILASRTKSSVRYVIIAPQDLAHSEGDAGWGRRGAFVAMHENALPSTYNFVGLFLALIAIFMMAFDEVIHGTATANEG